MDGKRRSKQRIRPGWQFKLYSAPNDETFGVNKEKLHRVIMQLGAICDVISVRTFMFKEINTSAQSGFNICLKLFMNNIFSRAKEEHKVEY